MVTPKHPARCTQFVRVHVVCIIATRVGTLLHIRGASKARLARNLSFLRTSRATTTCVGTNDEGVKSNDLA